MEHHVSINRACEACKRKKTKCDGKKPSCSLCVRIRNVCHYPQRKSKTRAQNRDRNSSIGSGSAADDANSFGMPDADPAFFSTPVSDEFGEIDWKPDTGSDASSRFSHTDTGSGSDVLRRESDSSVENPPPPCLDPELLGADASAQWGPYPDNYFFPDVQSGLGHSPTNQDMLEYLAQTLPDIWMPDPLTQSIIPRPIMMEDQTTITVSTKPSPDFIREHVPTPALTDTEMQSVDHIDPTLSETDVFGIPTVVVDELIDLYFRRVQVFLPLFHRPTFTKTYLREGTKDKYANLPEDSIFVIHGMLALSARFSTGSHFSHLSPHQRGNQFARTAQAIYQNLVSQPKPFTRTFPWLQGLILLAFYNQACRPPMGCDLTVQTCIKFAWDLELHLVDDVEEPTCHSVDDWSTKEARRRAWWAIWELDTFEGIASRRPSMIDRSRCRVMLPVSDEAWFSNTPVRSVEVSADILQCWKTLKDSPNQDERAWFLVSNIIFAHSAELCQRSRVSSKSISDIETVVSCFSLLYHENFRKRIANVTFDEETYAKSNWILWSRVMINSAKMAISILEDRTATVPLTIFAQPSAKIEAKNDPTPRQSPKPQPAGASRVLHGYRQPAAEIFRVFQGWPPDYIGFASPTLVCLVTGPRALLLRFARQMRRDQSEGDAAGPSIQEDLLVLILRHFAHYWNIGIFLLDFVRAFKEE